MIQRIQTLFLFLAAAAMAVVMSLPSMTYIAPDGDFALRAAGFTFVAENGDQTVVIAQTVLLRVIVFMSMVLPFLLIFVYKNREVQVKLCYLQFVLVVLAQILVVYYGYFAYADFITEPGIKPVFGIGLIMPLISFVFVWLAFRAIKKDINLVKSLDRIR